MKVSSLPRVVVAGDGVIGLSIALHLAARRVAVTLCAPAYTGAASPASAGMLAPSVDRAQGAVQDFSDAGPAAWDRMRALAVANGGPEFTVARNGILQIATTTDAAVSLRTRLATGDEWIDGEAVTRVEPALHGIRGAILHTRDGVVDAPAALHSLRLALAAMRVPATSAAVARVDASSSGAVVHLVGGHPIEADVLVVACGAWSNQIAGLPRRLPVTPLRGAMFAVQAPLVSIPVYEAGGHSYALPRGAQTVVGATSDDRAFDATPSGTDTDRLIDAAAAYLPKLRAHPRTAPWAGLRPITPDRRALIGWDPQAAWLMYAVGHGRNGFLQAAVTAEVVADLVLRARPEVDLLPFAPGRFRA